MKQKRNALKKNRFPIAAITDEFSPNLDAALDAMSEIGMTGVELRMIDGKNVLDLSDRAVENVVRSVERRRMQIVSLATPLLKCVLPDAPPVEERWQQDSFGSHHKFDDEPKMADRAFWVANKTGANIIRVFSYWRTTEPQECYGSIIEALCQLRDQAKVHGVTIAVENEHACNIATGAEAALMLSYYGPEIKLVWDPANAWVAGEIPFPNGYQQIAPARIAHVHAKDVRTGEGSKPEWAELGTGEVNWTGQLAALARNEYEGYLSLETHWTARGHKLDASAICGRKLVEMANAE